MFYTGKGDDGTSKTLRQDTRCNKDDPIFHALGTVDELGALLGVCFAKATHENSDTSLSICHIVRKIQEDLFIVQAELAGADKCLTHQHVTHLEDVIAELSTSIENPKAFVIAGSTELSAFLDLARTVARRVERMVIGLDETLTATDTRVYLNRLSSVLYVLARFAATCADEKEQNPKY